MNDFLSRLRRSHDNSSTLSAEKKNPEHLRVRLSVGNTDVMLAIVNNEGKAVAAADYMPIGPLGPLLRQIADIENRSMLNFGWRGTSDGHSFSIYEYPYLASYLETCSERIVDEKGEKVTLDPVVRKLTFEVTEGNEEQLRGEFKVDGERILQLVSPTLAYGPGKLCAIVDVGERYADLTALCEPFDVSMAEMFFSIFYSSCSNVKVVYGDREVAMGEDVIPLIPILVFEKIDSDNALILRVAESAGTLPMELFENFALTRQAHISDKRISVRPLGPSTLAGSRKTLYQSLTDNASKREAREIWAEGNTYIVPAEIASRFLYNSLATLINDFRIVGADKLKGYKIVAAKPKLNLRVGSGIDYLEGKATVEIDNEQFTLRDLLAQYAKQRYVTLSDGNRAVIDPTYVNRLQRIFRDPKAGENIKISFFDLPEVMEMLDDATKATKSFDAYRKFYQGFNSLGSRRLQTPGLKATLRDYQKAGVKWINYLYENRMGGCLADDMGLGKTVQTIAMLTRTVPKASKPALIVMPRSLLFNWQAEFKRFAPGLSVSTHYGTTRNLEEAVKAQVVLTSYAMVRNDIEEFLKHEFDYVILDESQNIKNVEAQVTQAVWLLKGEHRLAISGTPIENNLTELYSLFRFLNPAMFGSLKEYTDRYAAPIQRNGDEDATLGLRRRVSPFILRRLKRDVLADLPERTEQVLTVEMSPRQAALYEERRRYYAGEIGEKVAAMGASKATFELLQALLELRQIASIPEEKSNGTIESPKIEMLMSNLVPAVRNGHKVVVFFNFLAGIELTGHKLEREGIGYEVMTGATRDRKAVVERFQNDDDCRVMLMTIKTGGVGLNLTNADTVFIVEPWWNKAAEDQAVNRLHRIGQKNAVNCYYLITADTIEEKIRLLQEKKSALVDAIISTDGSAGKKLTADEINYLLSK